MSQPDFRSKLDAKLRAYCGFARNHRFIACRLVQYVGPDCSGAIDVPLAEVEAQIEGCIAEGYLVDWAARGQTLYLCVWEHPGPVPDWEYVFAERSIPVLTEHGRDARKGESDA